MARLRIGGTAVTTNRFRVGGSRLESVHHALRVGGTLTVSEPALHVRAPGGVWVPTWSTILPSGATWTPASLRDIPRPYGDQHVTYESLYQSGDDLQAVFERAPTGTILTLPEGVWEFNDFDRAYKKGLTFGRNGNGCIGIVGSGRGTIIRPSTSISSSNPGLDAGPDYVRGTSLEFYNIPGLVLSNLAIEGKPTLTWDGDYFTAVVLDSCHNAQISHLTLIGASPGYGNSPPGETFGLNIYRSNDVTITDCEIDGRHKTSGQRVCSSGIGWNGSGAYPNITYAENATIERTYIHHGKTGMPTFWYTRNIYTEDLWVFSNATGTGGLSGSCVNHEQVQGSIWHTRPYLFPNKTLGTLPPPWPLPDGDRQASGGFHMTLQVADIPGAGVLTQPDLVVEEPVWGMAYASTNPDPGMFMLEANVGYTGGISGASSVITTQPDIIHNGHKLEMVSHPAAGWQNQDPVRYFARIT